MEPMTPISTGILIVPDELMQDTLTSIIIDDYETAKNQRDSREYGVNSKGETLTFETWLDKLKDLYLGKREPKVTPWKFCSNRSMRIASAILEMLHSRLFGAVWNEDLTRWRPGEKTDIPKVERISKLMDWWVRVWSPMKDFFDNWVKYTAGFGDCLVEGSWEVDEHDSGQMEQLPITDEMGQQLTNPDGTPSISERPKLIREERTKTTLIPKESYYILGINKDIQRDVVIIEREYPYKVLEEMELNQQAVNVTSKLKDKLVVNVPSAKTETEEVERLKDIKRRNLPVKVLVWYGFYDVDGTGVQKSVRMMISREYKIYLGGVRMKDITYSGKRPIRYKKYSSYIQEIDSLFGEGVLDQVKELAEEIDAVFNQMTDGNTLSILRPGFFDPSGDVDAPAMEIAPNRMMPVSDPQHNIYFPEFDINTDRLINAIRLVLEFIERLTAASSYVMGKESEIVGGSGTATRTNAIMQSAEIRFSRPAERLKEGAGEILTMLLDLIQLNIPPGMENRVLGMDMEPVFNDNELSQEGIAGKFDAYQLSDPSMGSKATERELATIMYSMLTQNLIVATDPIKIYKITADFIKAHGKDPEEILGPAPSPDDIDEPEDENTLILQGDFNRVKANIVENHILHIQKHMEFLSSPDLAIIGQTAPQLVQTIIMFTQQHIQEHQLMMAAVQKLITNIGKSGGSSGSEQSGGDKPSNTSDDPNKGVDNVPGPAGEALRTQRTGAVQTPTNGRPK